MIRSTMCFALLAATAVAQDLTFKAPPQRKPFAIVDAVIHVGDGTTLDRGVLWFRDGRIAGIGADRAAAGVPDGCELFDAHGLGVWPGMIDAVTTVGLNEIDSVPATHDENEIGDFTPEVRAGVAVNPDATTIPVTRSNGVLTVGVFPQGGTVAGRASVVQLEGWTTEDMTVRADAGLVVEWPAMPVRRAGVPAKEFADVVAAATKRRDELTTFFADARAWLDARRADPKVPTDLRFAAMERVLAGELPVFVRADDVESIRAAIGFVVEAGMRGVLVGGRDAAQCADLLRAHGIPVVVMGTHVLPARADQAFDAPFRLPAELHAAGIAFCIAGTGGYENERNLPYHAATAVAYGLPLAEAERAVTAGAARILGVDGELGTLTVGKRATLVVTDGHPLEITTQVRAAWIDGRRVDLSNKQTVLARKYEEKYRQLGLWPGASTGR